MNSELQGEVKEGALERGRNQRSWRSSAYYVIRTGVTLG